MQCQMCTRAVEGQEWVDLVIMGKKTPSQAAAFFGIRVEDVMAHIYSHIIDGNVPPESRFPTTPPDAITPSTDLLNPDGSIAIDLYSQEILFIVSNLKKWSRSLAISQASSPRDIETGLKVMRELRLTIESLDSFQGRLASHKISSVTINIENMNNRILNLTNAIRTELCPECREKMLKIITNEQNNETKYASRMKNPKIISST